MSPPRAGCLLGLLAALAAERGGGAPPEAVGCQLEGWVSDAPAPGGGEDGYHVVCALSANAMLVYQGGVASDSPVRVDVGDGELREHLSQVLRFGDKIRYRVSGKPPLEWTRRPWALFTVKGQELTPGKEDKALAKVFSKREKPATLLLFEGGAWRWPTIRVGYVRSVMRGINLTTVSRQPALFEVTIDADRVGEGDGDELSIELLSDVVEVAKPQLKGSRGYGDTRTSEQMMIDYDQHPKLQKLRAGTAKLARIPEENLEPLQGRDPREFPDVRRFTDSEGYWNQRHATLLWYLAAPESGGQTWFPRAHGGPIPYGEWVACDTRGASVFPATATAVLFYSLKADGDIDEYSWHSGCPVKSGVKWAANSWIHNGAVGPRKRRRPGKEL